MEWTYLGELALTILVFAPGLILLALVLLLWPALPWRRAQPGQRGPEPLPARTWGRTSRIPIIGLMGGASPAVAPRRCEDCPHGLQPGIPEP